MATYKAPRTIATTAMVVEMRRRQEQGEARNAIAEAMGILPSMVAEYCPTPKTPPPDPEVVRLLREGKRQYEVVRLTGRSRTYVSRVARRMEPLTSMATAESAVENAIADLVAGTPTRTSGYEDVAVSIKADGIRSRVIRVLARGMVRDIATLAGLLRADGGYAALAGHELQHVVKSLQRQGLVRFQSRRRGTQDMLTDIALTEAGRREAGLKNGSSGPVVRIKPVPPEPKAEPSPDEPSPEPKAEPSPEPKAEPSPERKPPMLLVDATEYPLLAALANRRANIEQAAALLEAAGELDLALAAMSTAETITPLEQEILRFLANHNIIWL